MFRGTDEAVLQHLRIAGEEAMGIETAQELGFQQHAGGRSKDADLISQNVEVDARLQPTEALTMASSVVGTLM